MSATRSRTSLNCCTGSRPSVPPAKRRTCAVPLSASLTSFTHGPSTSWFSAPGGGGKLANLSSLPCASAAAGDTSAAPSTSARNLRDISLLLSAQQNAFSLTVMPGRLSVKPMDAAKIAALAARLDAAWRGGVPIAPISESDSVADAASAYAIQNHWTRLRLARGDKIAGRKIGLTAKAVQQQLGVDEPDYGALWQSSFYPSREGRVELPAAHFLQPRVEGEIAFLMARQLRGPGVTPREVLAATEACALGVEIVASRIADWRIKL